MMSRPVTLTNACAGSSQGVSLRFSQGRVAALQAAPASGDVVVDVGGERVLPGLINAHDHLQLNNFPRLKYRERHDNVSQWISDIDTRRVTDRAIAEPGAVRRESRLSIGGVKNILCGATTVAHHDPYYPELGAADFPCRVLGRYAWAHSLQLEGDERVRASYHATPPDVPWFIHAGEGVDESARREFARLEALGCLGANTRLVHGVAFSRAERERLAARGAGLIWCPSSNLHLFEVTVDCSDLVALRCVALGSDSRLSGAGDLLDELRVARDCGVAESDLEAMVTSVGAKLLGLDDRGEFKPGALADFIILPPDLSLGVARRADLRCVVLGGVMVCGDPDYAHALMAPERRVAASIDGRDKVLDRGLAELLRAAPFHDEGVRLAEPRGRAA